MWLPRSAPAVPARMPGGRAALFALGLLLSGQGCFDQGHVACSLCKAKHLTSVISAKQRLRCRRHQLEWQFSAADVVDDVIDAVRRRVFADWQRTSRAVTALAGTSPDWFPRVRPPLTVAFFADLWCAGGVIARVQPPAAGTQRPSLQWCFDACRLPRAPGREAAAAAGCSRSHGAT